MIVQFAQSIQLREAQRARECLQFWDAGEACLRSESQIIAIISFKGIKTRFVDPGLRSPNPALHQPPVLHFTP